MKFFNLLATEILTWMQMLIGCVPGRIGNMLRQMWFGPRFKKHCKTYIGTGCEFISPQTMNFEGLIKIGKNSFFTAEYGVISVGNNTAFNMNVHINASVGGQIKIGESCLIGPNVVIRTAGHRFDDIQTPIRQQGHIAGDIHIDDDVWIGANVTILRGVTIGKGAVIGAGAVVTRDIPSLAIAVGVPARIIKFRNQEIKEK